MRRCRKVVVVLLNTILRFAQNRLSPLAVLLAGGVLVVACAGRPPPKEEVGNHDPAALTIVAEMALARGDCKTAAESYADAAVHDDAPPLARHASEVAL